MCRDSRQNICYDSFIHLFTRIGKWIECKYEKEAQTLSQLITRMSFLCFSLHSLFLLEFFFHFSGFLMSIIFYVKHTHISRLSGRQNIFMFAHITSRIYVASLLYIEQTSLTFMLLFGGRKRWGSEMCVCWFYAGRNWDNEIFISFRMEKFRANWA